ncbi:hypothetical protein HAHE_20820 [Haloferula helveola]|uniref:Pre-peptidase C-terminal domain-containing protein n=1 Tax=Haloferula helveola TaxID=490095 RepID=A0ABM7RFT4_9BACT|nr:hypothetical protein HAHE_20820 [Haloferula helveola]
MRILLPTCLANCLLWTASAQSIDISELGLDTGRFEVTAITDTDLIVVLDRFDGDLLPLTGTTPSGMAIVPAAVPTVVREFDASGSPRGFFDIFGRDLATDTTDSDGDGVTDRTELKTGGFLNPVDGVDGANADVFDITLDASVSDGIPAAGAGNIEMPNHADIYRFEGVAGTGVFVDAVSHDLSINLHDYRLFDPYGNPVKSSAFGLGDMGPVTLPLDGEYVLIVGDTGLGGSGTYAINLSVIPAPETFVIAVGDTITPDDPAPGAGTIEAPGAFDIYSFDANAGDRVFLNTLSYSGTNTLIYRLLDPASTELDSQQFNLGDMGTVELPSNGTYTIEVGEVGNDDTGTYSIGLTAVPDPESFGISIGDTISDGAPGPGAGNIETPGAFDHYTFTGAAGQKVFVDSLGFSGLNLIDFKLFDPSDSLVFSSAFGLSDVGTLELPETGTYRLEVGEAGSDRTGTYSIAITEVPPPDVFGIAIGDTVSNGIPAAGAGNIEAPGAFDHYTFAGTAGQKIFIDQVSYSGPQLIDIRLFDPSDSQIAYSAFGLSDIGTLELPATGTYRLEVGEAADDNTGTYTIGITEVPAPDVFAIAIGDTVSDGIPGSGAGNIETPGAYDRYTFTGTAGQKIFVNMVSYSGVNTINYRLLDPSDAEIGNKQFNLGDIATVELPASGTYTLEVGEAPNDDTGTYTIAITDIPAPDSFSISIGDTVSDGVPGAGAGNIEVPGAFDVYTFTGTAGEFVNISHGSFVGLSTVNYRLLDPTDSQLDSQQFNLGDMGVIQLPSTGTYTIEVGEATNQATGTYDITVAPHVP